MPYVCGNAGFVSYGAGVVRLDVTSWTATESADTSETTNTGSAGYKELITCKKYMSGTIEADYDPVLSPKAVASVSIYAGDAPALVLNCDTGGHYDLPEVIVTRLNWTQPAGDKVSYSFDWESTGAFTFTE